MANPSDENKAVFCPATLKLVLEIKLGEGKLSPMQQEYTDFGKEVGRDEINWWVFKRERDIEELRKQTTLALEAVQKLKQASELLTRKRTEAYSKLLEMLREFAEAHEQEIGTLYHYVRWLNSRDSLAPTILFTYRVWGSTRMGDRTIKFDENESEPKPDTIKRLTEIILGLLNNYGTLTLFKAEYEIGADIYESVAYDEEAPSEIRFQWIELSGWHRG
jgi:hypothetical protein